MDSTLDWQYKGLQFKPQKLGRVFLTLNTFLLNFFFNATFTLYLPRTFHKVFINSYVDFHSSGDHSQCSVQPMTRRFISLMVAICR